MAGELETVVREMLGAMDSRDAAAILRHAADEIQGIDEISRRWMRGLDDVGEYVRGLVAQVEEVRSEVRDAREVVWGDLGLVTFWLEQDYVLGGEHQHVSAPSSAVLRRAGDGWKIVLFHSIPLPEEAGS